MSDLGMVARVGIDVGFGDVKVCWFDDKFHTLSFPALLGRAETRASIGVGLARRQRIDEITYRGRTYFVSDDPLQTLIESRLVAARQDSERIGSDEERILMLAGMAKAGIDRALVVTGLPVPWWDKRRKLVRSWAGVHEIEWNGKEKAIEVCEVRPVWQPLGSFYHRTLLIDGSPREDRKVMRAGWGIIDVGFNTTDLSGVVNLQPIARWSGGIRAGVRDALDILADDIERRYGVRRPLHEIAHALRTRGSIQIYKDDYSLDGNAADALQSLAQEIVGEATRRWGQADRFRSVLVTGGGAALLGKQIVKAFPRNAEVLWQPGLANAVGFAKFARRKIFRRDR